MAQDPPALFRAIAAWGWVFQGEWGFAGLILRLRPTFPLQLDTQLVFL
jgi:hypothetical protein